jgi:hypothetical protein
MVKSVAIPALALLISLMISGCASSVSTTQNARVYGIGFENAVETVLNIINEMRMEVESHSPSDARPLELVAVYMSDGSFRTGEVRRHTQVQTIRIRLEELEDAVLIRVDAPRSDDMTRTTTRSEVEIRFLRHLDRRLGGA